MAKAYCVRGQKSEQRTGPWAFPRIADQQTEVTHMVASILRSHPAGVAHIQSPPSMEKKMLSVYTAKKEQNCLSHAKLEQKGNANRNPEMPLFGSCSF